MDDSFKEAVTQEIEKASGRLLIVDDEPAAATMLQRMLKGHGHEVRVVTSGEACLDAMDEFRPEVILLDIEMPGGIDGYETAQQVRRRFDRANLTILFLSGHDTLEDRLRAYDAGGDDFVAKPFVAKEIRHKIDLAVGARIRRKDLVAEKISLEETANVAMQGYDEMGAILKFTRGALSCRTLTALADLMLASLRATQVECLVQLRGSAAAGKLTLTPRGLASPLEESVIELMRSHDRIFQFKSRMIVNYDSVSVLVVNMPANDETLAGRIRDYAAMIAEAAEDAVANISLRGDAVERAMELRSLAAEGHADMKQLQASYLVQVADTRVALEQMTDKIEAMYYRFGLSDSQEAGISDTVRATKNEVLVMFDRYGADLDGRFATILEGLNRASSYRIDMQEASAKTTEVWV